MDLRGIRILTLKPFFLFMRLTEERKKLLKDAVEKDGGVLKMSRAFMIYSNKDSAKNAVKAMEAYGYVEFLKPGYFRVKDLPEGMQDLEEQLEEKNYSEREFVKGILERVFYRIKMKQPSVDEEKVKYVPEN